jgi:hypothetical protein
MKRNKTLQRAEAFVRAALSDNSKGPVDESTVKSVARKVSKAIPAQRQKKEERESVRA